MATFITLVHFHWSFVHMCVCKNDALTSSIAVYSADDNTGVSRLGIPMRKAQA